MASLNNCPEIWKYQKKFLTLQRERRSQVEPRCAERWHLRDDEQFDLAAWFLSLEYSWSRVGQLLFYFDISLSIKLLLVSASRAGIGDGSANPF